MQQASNQTNLVAAIERNLESAQRALSVLLARDDLTGSMESRIYDAQAHLHNIHDYATELHLPAEGIAH